MRSDLWIIDATSSRTFLLLPYPRFRASCDA